MLSDRASGRPPTPLNAPGRMRRLGPFGIVVLAGLLVALGLRRGDVPGMTVLITIAGALALACGLAFIPWERLPPGLQVLAPLLTIGLIAYARDAIGGPASGLSLLLVVPILWSALYGSDAELAVVLIGAALAIAVPVVFGSESADDVSRIILLALVGLLIAWILRGTRRDAATDSLTGIANRRAWGRALDREVERAARTGVPGTLVLMDLDLFKAFNDSRGHAAGDELLCKTALAWRGVIRPEDLLARVGGEEFAVLLPATTDREAMAVADRLRRAMPDGQTCSAGVAVITGEIGADSAMRAADAALYEAKARGRNRTVRAATRPPGQRQASTRTSGRGDSPDQPTPMV